MLSEGAAGSAHEIAQKEALSKVRAAPPVREIQNENARLRLSCIHSSLLMSLFIRLVVLSLNCIF